MYRDYKKGYNGLASSSEELMGDCITPLHWIVNTRTGGGLRITPSGGGGGGHIMPPSISAPMRARATNFGGYLGPYYNFFWPKFWDHGSTPSWSKRVEFPKC